VELSRDIYYSPEMPPEDVEAQVRIALAQLGILPPQPAREWLSKYLEGFRVRIGDAVRPAERRQARAAVRWIGAEHLLEHWSFPEDWRGFRKYVGECVRLALREYLGKPNSQLAVELEAADERPHAPAQAEDTLVEKIFRHEREVARESKFVAEDKISVIRTAEILGLSVSYLHRLIRQRAIRTMPGRPRTISREELERLFELRGARLRCRQLAEKLEKSGKTREAARKAAYRKYGRGPRVGPSRPDRSA